MTIVKDQKIYPKNITVLEHVKLKMNLQCFFHSLLVLTNGEAIKLQKQGRKGTFTLALLSLIKSNSGSFSPVAQFLWGRCEVSN